MFENDVLNIKSRAQENRRVCSYRKRIDAKH